MIPTHTRVLAELAHRIHAALDPLLPARGETVALLDFPDHPNVGDTAIWLGEVSVLDGAGVRIAYASTIRSHSPRDLARAVGRRPILLHGGGNLGDLWPGYQRFRESVIAACPGNRIIQLPQTIHFQDPDALRRARAVFNAHPDLTLLVRDRQSLEVAANEFTARVLLCPDMALALGPIPRPAPPTRDLLCLLRADRESAHDEAAGGADVVDWPAAAPLLQSHAYEPAIGFIARHPTLAAPVRPALWRLFGSLARARLARGVALLAPARVVVTDRLHGHLLALQLGIPHVVLDNSYGKVSRFVECWTQGSGLTYRAASIAEARALARDLLQRSPAGG